MNIVKKEYKAPMWKVIVDELVDELRRSDLPEGSAFYSIEELAEKYSVSSITSRRVLNELESNGLISKARGRNAVILRPNPLRKVVLIDPADCLQNRPDYGYICMAVYRGIIEELARRGIESTVINPRHFERFDFSQPHDVIVLPEYNRLPLGLRKEMRENPLLNVVVPHALEPIPGIPTIGSDLRGGMLHTVQIVCKPCRDCRRIILRIDGEHGFFDDGVHLFGVLSACLFDLHFLTCSFLKWT